MANPFDRFDNQGVNPFDRFDDSAPKPKPIGAAAQGDFLREELKNADWGTRNIAAFGTALSDVWEGLKQKVGQGDEQAIEANKIIADSAPVGAALGNAAMMAGPMGIAGNSVKGAAAISGAFGAAKPVSGPQTFENIAKGTAQNIGVATVAGAAGQWGANKVGGAISQKLNDLALRKAQNIDKDAMIGEALDAGLVIPPSSVKPTFANTVKESISGKIATAQTFSNKNAAKFNEMARRELGLADDAALSPDLLQGRRDLAYQVGYKPVADLPGVAVDTPLLMQIRALHPASMGGAVKTPAQGQIDEIAQAIAAQKQWTGPQLLADIKALRAQANANFKAAGGPSPNPAAGDLARFQKNAAEALEELAARNMANPNAAQMFRDARQYIAKTHTVEDAMLPGSNAFDPRRIPARSMGKLTGELKTAAEFAKNFPKASQSEAQVAGPAVNQLGALLKPFLGGAGGVAGTAIGGPVLGAIGAAAPFVLPPVMRAHLGSRAAQNALRELYQLGLPTRMAGRVAQQAPIGLTVGGLYALGQ
jgi:hypothetical protein